MTTAINVKTAALRGIEAVTVETQVRMSAGLPSFIIVGLADKAVAESRERVRAALSAIGLSLPPKRLTVNLSPADLPKEGSHYDLPIALGVLAAMGAVPSERLENLLAMGELSLEGELSRVAGALPAAVTANERGLDMMCPPECGAEAAWAGGDIEIVAPRSLAQAAAHLRGDAPLARAEPGPIDDSSESLEIGDVKGQESAKRALEVAAAGGHHVLMIGPPGSGKSLLAERFPSLLPPMDASETLETSMIASSAGLLAEGRVSRRRPFRAPHHSASRASLVGGGRKASPGEASLAHNGALFLDELPEFHPQALEALRQPLEIGRAVIARAEYRVSYPARFQLVAAMNPCRCGGDADGSGCRRGPKCAADYQSRISAPLLDRIDIRLETPPARISDLGLKRREGESQEIAARVSAARTIQSERLRRMRAPDDVRVNARLDGALLEAIAAPDREGVGLLRAAAESMGLSARGYHRTLRLARTLADLDGEKRPRRPHVAEALGYRGEPPALRRAA